MKHPTSIELVDFRQGKLPPEQASDIENHIAVCDICSRECNELAVIETHIAAWKDPQVSETLVADTMRILHLNKTVPDLNLTGNLNDGWKGNLWFRRIVLAAGAVAATLLLQVLVWNPLATPTTFRAKINFIPEAFAQTPEQAVPDTVLILTLNQDLYLSTPLLHGRYGFDELEELASALDSLGKRDQIRLLFVVGPDADNPVTFRTEMLRPLMEELGIDSISTGTGVVALETAEELTATITLPLHIDTFDYLTVDSFYSLTTDTLYSPTIDSFNSLSIDSFYSPTIDTSAYRSLLFNRMLQFTQPVIDYTVIRPQTFIDPISLELRTHRLGLTPTLRITPSRVRSRIRPYPDEVLLADLLSPSQAILTVNTDGNILIDRAVIPERELERALRRLRFLNPRMSLLILVREDAEPDDPGYRVLEIAKRLGMRVSLREIKDP